MNVLSIIGPLQYFCYCCRK